MKSSVKNFMHNFTSARSTKLLVGALLTLGIFVFSLQTFASPATKILPAPKKLSEHVYAWIGPLDGPSKENHGYRMNLAFVVGTKAVAVIDTGYTEAMAKEMLIHIRAITDKPVKYAINTNSVSHRFMGNPAFRQAGVTIIAQSKSAERMAAQSGSYAGTIERVLELPKDSVKFPQAPDQLVNKTTVLNLGGVSLKLHSFRPTHTPSSLVIEIPADKIVYASDVLYAGRLLALLPDSNTKSWIAAIDQLKQFGNVTFIPGHGQPGPLKSFDFPTRSYLNLLLTHMDKMVDQGVDAQDAITKLDQSRFSKLANYEMLAGRNASWAYLEREQAAFE
jgi:glyoxylase-like metal-dependent hydrolase (beta-lactamase superfamily II)